MTSSRAVTVNVTQTAMTVDISRQGQPGPRGATGPPGPGGSPGGGAVVTGEWPSGTYDGVNAVFALANVPQAGTVVLFRNGLRERQGTSYVVSGATVTFTAPPLPTDDVTVDYLLEG